MKRVWTIEGDSVGRKIEITVTGNKVLTQEMVDTITNSMLRSRKMGPYRSVAVAEDFQSGENAPWRHISREDCMIVLQEEDFQESSHEEESTASDIIEIINKEIQWCEKHGDTSVRIPGLTPDFQEGFIKGLSQAKNLIILARSNIKE